MGYDKRIWKTAALAVALTLVAGALVMRLNDWAKGLNSEFVVYGQTGTSGTGGGSGTTSAATTYIIPQVAVGPLQGTGVYSTFIVIANPSPASVTASAIFYSQAAVSNQIGFTTNNSAVPSITGSTLSAITIPGNSALVLTSITPVAYVGGWGQITTSGSVNITAGFEVRDPVTNVLYSRVGIPASPANMQTFVIARSRNQQSGLDTGFAIVNTQSTKVTINVTLRDASGNVTATAPITLGPYQQVAQFAASLFFPTPGTEPPVTGTGFFTMTFSASGPQVAATALSFEGEIDTSFPVSQLN